MKPSILQNSNGMVNVVKMFISSGSNMNKIIFPLFHNNTSKKRFFYFILSISIKEIWKKILDSCNSSVSISVVQTDKVYGVFVIL